MQKVNIADVPFDPDASPTGKFRATGQAISAALGRERDSLDLTRRHPFDLELVRIPPGASLCPYHEHSAQWEFYLVVSGVGTVRDADGETEVQVDDAFYYPPNQPHELRNCGTDDFVYFVIADNPIGGSCYYPDSSKWAVQAGPRRLVVRGEEVDYFAGEE